jgi:hypothetical protein
LGMSDGCGDQRCEKKTYGEEFQASDHLIVPLRGAPEMKRNVAAHRREMQVRPETIHVWRRGNGGGGENPNSDTRCPYFDLPRDFFFFR